MSSNGDGYGSGSGSGYGYGSGDGYGYDDGYGYETTATAATAPATAMATEKDRRMFTITCRSELADALEQKAALEKARDLIEQAAAMVAPIDPALAADVRDAALSTRCAISEIDDLVDDYCVTDEDAEGFVVWVERQIRADS